MPLSPHVDDKMVQKLHKGLVGSEIAQGSSVVKLNKDSGNARFSTSGRLDGSEMTQGIN